MALPGFTAHIALYDSTTTYQTRPASTRGPAPRRGPGITLAVPTPCMHDGNPGICRPESLCPDGFPNPGCAAIGDVCCLL